MREVREYGLYEMYYGRNARGMHGESDPRGS